jgi:hypothetical protein
MSEAEVEMWATLAIWFIGAWFVGSTVGWWIFLQTFRLVDNYLQDRYFAKMGWKKMKDDSGKTWYVGREN